MGSHQSILTREKTWPACAWRSLSAAASAMGSSWTRSEAVARVQMRDKGDSNQAGGAEERQEHTESKNIENVASTDLVMIGR